MYDVASLVDAGTPANEFRELYPKLTPSQIELASIYAKANPTGQAAAPAPAQEPIGLYFKKRFVVPL